MKKNVPISISDSVLRMYPETRIAYLLATGIQVLNEKSLPIEFVDFCEKAFGGLGLKREDIVTNDTIRRWREIYLACGVKPKTYKSSVEALVIRMLKNAYIPRLTPVDLYNYISVSSMLPMGGYDIESIFRGLELRHGKGSDNFTSMHHSDQIDILPEHIIYADSHPTSSVVSWMWNHKDSRRTMITPSTNNALFIIDCTMESEYNRQEWALTQLKKILEQLGCIVLQSGKVDINQPSYNLEYQHKAE